MTIYEIINSINNLDDDLVICARRPWTEETDFHIMKMTDDFDLPRSAKESDLDYFLEVHIANETLELLKGKVATEKKKAELLLYYAENDAYPDWAFQ